MLSKLFLLSTILQIDQAVAFNRPIFAAGSGSSDHLLAKRNDSSFLNTTENEPPAGKKLVAWAALGVCAREYTQASGSTDF